MNTDRFHRFSHKVFGVLLAYSMVGTVLGLHRLWMRQKYWWACPLAFLVYVSVGNKFLELNAEHIQNISEVANRLPHLSEMSHTWLLIIAFGWILFVLYDLNMVWTWPVPMEINKVAPSREK